MLDESVQPPIEADQLGEVRAERLPQGHPTQTVASDHRTFGVPTSVSQAPQEVAPPTPAGTGACGQDPPPYRDRRRNTRGTRTKVRSLAIIIGDK